MTSVGVLSRIPNLFQELRRKLPKLTVYECQNGKDENIKSSDIIVSDFDLLGPILNDLPERVKWVQGTWAGADALMPFVDVSHPPKVPIVRFSGVHFGRLISEYVIACIINHERDIFAVHENQKDKDWCREGRIADYRSISDLSVGVLGIGNIGSKLGQSLDFCGAKVLGYGRRPSINLHDFTYLTTYYSGSGLGKFLKDCDYIVNTLPNTPETKGLLNGDILKHCQEKQSVFINVGRGSVINDEDLVGALKLGWLSGAYLDVFNEEPLPKQSELWGLKQVKITPHVAAVSRTRDIVEQFEENLDVWKSGRGFQTLLDFKRGY